VIIYNGSWSIFIQYLGHKFVRSQSNLVYTIERVLPVCDQPYHMNNGFQLMWVEIKNVWNHAFVSLIVCNCRSIFNMLYIEGYKEIYWIECVTQIIPFCCVAPSEPDGQGRQEQESTMTDRNHQPMQTFNQHPGQTFNQNQVPPYTNPTQQPGNQHPRPPITSPTQQPGYGYDQNPQFAGTNHVQCTTVRKML